MSDYAHPVTFSAATAPYVAHYVLLIAHRGEDVERPQRIAKPVVGWAVVTRTEENTGHGLVNVVEPMVQGEYGESVLTLAYDYGGGPCRFVGLHPEGEPPDEFRVTQAERELVVEAQRRQQIWREQRERGDPLAGMALRQFLGVAPVPPRDERGRPVATNSRTADTSEGLISPRQETNPPQHNSGHPEVARVERGAFLDRMFGDRAGGACLAHGRPYRTADGTYRHHGWTERRFDWPRQREELLDEVEEWAQDPTDIYVCPALRVPGTKGRRKGDALPPTYLWTDLDRGPRDPELLDTLGALIVESGQPGHLHVYVPLARPVDLGTHIRLNKALADRLDGEKWTDESLLRLPGTVNRKPAVPPAGVDSAPAAPVRMAVPASRSWDPDEVAALLLGEGDTVDSLLSADLVTADGEFVRAGLDENADLFWGLRGGGGNFGVVTDFRFRLHPLGPQVMAGAVFWPMEQAVPVLRRYRDWIADCPDELMTLVAQRLAPPLPAVPPDLVGRPVIAVLACYTGDADDGERVLRPMREFASPVLDLFAAKPFVAHQQMLNPSFRHGCWYYVRSCDVADLSDPVIDVVAEFGRRITSPLSSIALWQMGGAVARVADAETAFSGRGAGFTFNINGNSETADGFDEQRQWARDYWSALAPFHTGVYVNFLMEEGDARVRQAYGDAKYERLRALKRKYDPTNVFRRNQNIQPA